MTINITIIFFIIAAIAIGCVGTVYINNHTDNEKYPQSNITITVMDKFDPSFTIIDTNEDRYTVDTLELYLQLHPHKKYDVVVEIRSDLPVISPRPIIFITELIGETKQTDDLWRT